MFILASLIVLPFYFIEDTDTLAQELEVTVPKALIQNPMFIYACIWCSTNRILTY